MIVVSAVVSFAGALFITSGYGPGLDPDSMAYVGAAKSLAHGDGLRVPMGKWEGRDSTVALTVWPPAFPVAMSIAQKLGAQPMTSARIVIALSAAATAALVFAVLGGVTGLSSAGAAVALIVATPSFVSVHLNVLSEPLFLAAMMLTLYGMVSRRPGVAATGAVAAVMTRYAGVSAGAAAAIWFLFFSNDQLRDRIRRAAIASAPAAMAFIFWIAHNARVAVVQSPIRIAYHPGITETAREGIRTLMASVAPGAAGSIAIAATMVFITALGLAFARLKRGSSTNGSGTDKLNGVAGACAVLLITYLWVIGASRMFVGGSIRFDARILSPAIMLAELSVVLLISTSSLFERRYFKPAIAVLAAIWLAASLRVNGALVSDSIEDGNDFAASDWRDSPMMEWIARNAGRKTIYTNWPAAIYFNAHRHPFDIPTTLNPDSVRLFGKAMEESGGIFAAFNTRNFDYPANDSIAAAAGLVQIREFEDGILWAPPKGLSSPSVR